jgi:hypothetical protein
MAPVSSFTIDVPEAQLVDLRERLRRTRWTDAVVDGWDQGADVRYVRELCMSWAEEFDWRAQEARLNGFPHRMARVDDVAIHFVHQRAGSHPVMPVLMLHGWPSSFLQMLPVVPMLADRFDLVIPSLPGFGFSGRPTRPGMSVRHIGELFHGLMTDVLGYERYGVRGSDLGAGVAQQMAIAHPDEVLGLHTGARRRG